MTSLRPDAASLEPLDMVVLFEWDGSPIGSVDKLYWHPGTTVAGGPIVFGGRTYEPLPIEAEGFSLAAAGKLPRPTLRASNVGGLLGAYLRSIKDGLGAKITRRRTLGKYLDAANFPGGNPYADPTAEFPKEIYFVSRKAQENAVQIELELAVRFDVNGIQVPRRQVLASLCPWRYRSPECSYGGPPVQDIYGNPTSDITKDQCRKTLDACKARFIGTRPLPFGGFPSSLLMRGG